MPRDKLVIEVQVFTANGCLLAHQQFPVSMADLDTKFVAVLVKAVLKGIGTFLTGVLRDAKARRSTSG